jgi:hypothetical protein
MTDALPKPSDSEPSFSRALTLWRNDTRREAPSPEAGERLERPLDGRGLASYAPYAVALTLALGAGAAFASLATAPALTDSIDTVAALDARTMGLAKNLDPSGQQAKASTLNRDVGTMKAEITRLQRALDQSRTNQSAQSKAAAGQAASNQEEVRSLKAEIAALQKTLEATRDGAANKIEQLSARIEQSKGDAGRVAELRDRLDRMEKQASAERPAAREGERRAEAPETTGSVGTNPQDERPRSLDARAQELGERDADQVETAESPEPAPAQREVAARDAGGQVIRNWTVREVYRGVALLESRRGMIEVVRGARAPGIGRVRSIERRDGQWVVVTDRGVVLQRREL